MRTLNILVIGIVIFFSGCNPTAEKTVQPLTGPVLKQLVTSAAVGNKAANDTLFHLYDYSIPPPGIANNISVDSLMLPSGKRYYSVIAEFPNPVYNRFAVYDSTYKVYIIDKSLNGNLSGSVIDTTFSPFISIKDSFISRDTLGVERLSLYFITDSTVNLSFRTFTRFIEPGNEFNQKIDEISSERIKTSITSSKNTPVDGKGDIFIFNNAAKTFISGQDLFNNFVTEEIKNYKITTQKPEITDYQSYLQSVGITPGSDTLKYAANVKNSAGYALKLDENWKELKNIAISEYLKRKFRGTGYLNNNLGASLYVISLDPADSAEMYIDYKLNNVFKGNYTLRYTDKIETAKTFIRFLEYSCGQKKFLVILESSKYTYDIQKPVYDEIINNFFIDC